MNQWSVLSGQWSVNRFLCSLPSALCALFLAACATAPKPEMKLDLKISNGRILDGSGAPWFRGDIGIRGDQIIAIGNLDSVDATANIDARDQMVSPGFIDLLGWSEYTALRDPYLEAKVRQGVTTEVTGEGHSPGPIARESLTEAGTRPEWETLGEYLDLVDRKGAAINFALFVGSSNPRELVIGKDDRDPTADEMRQMEAIVEQAMREGAIGLSTSLIYVPAMYSKTEEIVNLARAAAKHGGVYFTHMREEGDLIDQGLDEAFRVGREAGIPVNIWHLKAAGRANWGRMPHVISRIEAARREGIDVAANVYPYAASSTALSTLVPNWALEGGYSELRQRLGDPVERAKIVDALAGQVEKRGERGIYVSLIRNPAQKQYEKKFVHQIAAEMGVTPAEALARLFSANDASPRVIFFSMHEDDVQYALRQPWVSVGSDSGSPAPEVRAAGEAVHPRGYGSFPRVLGRYARHEKLFTLEEAVRKMTSQAAARANIRDRGILRAGMKADIIVFDADNVRDLSTFDDPHHFSEGIVHVIVNGVPVLRNGVMTRALPGKTIRGPGYRPATR